MLRIMAIIAPIVGIVLYWWQAFEFMRLYPWALLVMVPVGIILTLIMIVLVVTAAEEG